MKQVNNFSKKDLVVVLICIIFLIANIAAVGHAGRKRALATVCLSNLRKWGQIFQSYTADNDGFFHARQIGSIYGYSRMWQYVYKPYYSDKTMRFCPTADNPMYETGPFGTWNLSVGSYYPLPDLPMPGEREYEIKSGNVQEGFFTGSYGMCRFIENMQGGSISTDPAFWRKTGLKGGDKAPVLTDCMYLYFYGSATAEPPAYDGDYTTPDMHWICINRHDGFVNAVFLDFSARKVGLKELWTLKFSQTTNTCDPAGWTICSFGGNKAACAAAWDAVAPWMKDFPEY